MNPLKPIQQAALDQLVPAAIAAEKATGFPAELTITQFAVESDWGAKPTGDFNFWGLTRAVAPSRPQKLCRTHEVLTLAQFAALPMIERETVTARKDLGNGKYRYSLSRQFPSFDSMEQAVNQYIALIVKSPARYKEAWAAYQANRDLDALIDGIARGGYATDPSYSKLLRTIAHGQRVTEALKSGRGTADAPPVT